MTDVLELTEMLDLIGAEIDALQAKNKQLLEALEQITTYRWETHNPEWPVTIARAALWEGVGDV